MCKHSLWGAHLSQWVEARRGTNTKKLPDLNSLKHSHTIQAYDLTKKGQP